MNEILAALIGAVVGSAITGWVVLLQTRTLLAAESRRREQEREQETKSIAIALLWEVDDFYKLSIRNVNRALKNASPSELGFYVKPMNFRSFTVFDSMADRVGLFEPALVQGIVGFYGNARVYQATFADYRVAMEQLQAGHNEAKGKAVTLLDQIKKSAKEFVPLTKTICVALAERAKAPYTFEEP